MREALTSCSVVKVSASGLKGQELDSSSRACTLVSGSLPAPSKNGPLIYIYAAILYSEKRVSCVTNPRTKTFFVLDLIPKIQ